MLGERDYCAIDMVFLIMRGFSIVLLDTRKIQRRPETI